MDALTEMKNQKFSPILPTQQKFTWLSKLIYIHQYIILYSNYLLDLLNFSDGGIIDPKALTQNTAHVYVFQQTVYSVDLVHVDIVKNKNSYYKIQVLESNDKTE